MTEVVTRDEAIASVDQALQVWSTTVRGVLLQASDVVRAVKERVDRIVQKCAEQVASTETLLAVADEEQRRYFQAQLVRAKEAHDTARRASVRVNDVASRLAQLSRRHTLVGTSQVASARVQLSAMSQALESYRSGGGTFGGGDSSGTRAATTGGSPIAAMGLADLDVSAADLNENPVLDDNRSNGTFGKEGLSRADYRWAVQTWNDTVGPGVASGKTREDFAERDANSNAQPLRRTADVYDMFLGSDRIRAERQSDGSLNIINGRHRLLIARELGIKNLPGEVF